MKRTLILIAILLALGITYYLIPKDKDDVKVEKIMNGRNFAVNADEIGRVVITEKNGNVTTLTNDEDDIWYVDGKRMSRNQKSLIREALTKVQINSIPIKKANKNIFKNIAKIGILVRVFDKQDELIRSYYVGGVPQGERGTYYVMEGYDQPYLMELPGMQGSTRGRFVKRPTDWLDRAMFRYPKKDIATISVEYPKSKNESYIVEKNGEKYDVKPMFPFTKKVDGEVNPKLMEKYLSDFHVGFFTEADISYSTRKDSIIANMEPYCKLRVTNDAGDVTSLDFYPTNVADGINDVQATGPNIDRLIERFYVNVDEGERYMLTQQRLAKHFLWSYKWFFR